LYGLGFWVASGIISGFGAGGAILGKVCNTLFWGFGGRMITPFVPGLEGGYPQNTHHLLWIPLVLLANVALYVLIFGSAGIVVQTLRTPR
jgi:hypothetical protein